MFFILIHRTRATLWFSTFKQLTRPSTRPTAQKMYPIPSTSWLSIFRTFLIETCFMFLMFCFLSSGIIPADCSYQVKKKSIEIHLEKTSIAQWGSVGIKCQTVFSSSTTSPSSAITTSFTDISNNNISFKAAVASFAHNKWTPCAPGTSTDNSPETSPPSYFNNNNRNSLALVTYEEPIGEFVCF